MGCPTSTVGHNKQASNSWTNQAADAGFRAKRAWSQKCHWRPTEVGVRVTSAFLSIATKSRTSHHVGDGPIVLQNSKTS